MRAQTAVEEEEEIEEQAPAEATQPERKPLFKMPNFREDVRALPSIIRSKPILFLPLALLVGGLALLLILPALSPDIAGLAGYYIQFFFAPPALFTFFIAGFLAPRASYLIGFIYGLIAAAMWSAAVLIGGNGPITPTEPGAPAPAPVDPVIVVVNLFAYGVLYGTLAAALASWYRDFLRGIQERGRARRADKEVDERARRREQRQEARKIAKQRPT